MSETIGVAEAKLKAVLPPGCRTSEKLGEFAKAWNKAQAQMEAAKKDRTNPHFGSKFADFASVVSALRAPFGDNGLSFFQFPLTEGTRAGVDTTIIHVSGEFIAAPLLVPVAKLDPQGVGSAITYAKRYSLAAMAGMPTDEDDDGNAASFPPKTGDLRGELKARNNAAAKTSKEPAKPPPSEPKATATDKPLTPQARANALWKRAARVTTLEGFRLWTKRVVGKTRSEEMTSDDVDHLEAAISEFEASAEAQP